MGKEFGFEGFLALILSRVCCLDQVLFSLSRYVLCLTKLRRYMQIDLSELVGTFNSSLQTLATTLQTIEKHVTEQNVRLEREKIRLQERRTKLEEEERLLGEEEKKLRKEKKAFSNMLKEVSDSSSDSVLELNVGGENITTLKSTLCSVPGSMLEAMFSGRHALKVVKGRYFLDRDPATFR